MPNKQSIATSKWCAKNKEYSAYLNHRSRARSFINKRATLADIEMLEELIEKRKNELKK